MENTDNSKPVTKESKNPEEQHSIDNESSSSSNQTLSIGGRGEDDGSPQNTTDVDEITEKSQQISIDNTQILDEDVEDHHKSTSENDNVVQHSNKDILSGEVKAVLDVGAENVLITNTTTTTSTAKQNDIVTMTKTTTNVSSTNNTPIIRYMDLVEKAVDSVQVDRESPTQQQQRSEEVNKLKECQLKLQQQQQQYELQLEQLKAALAQKDNMIALFQRENAILEKEKEAVCWNGIYVYYRASESVIYIFVDVVVEYWVGFFLLGIIF